jgi:hypothetical protein
VTTTQSVKGTCDMNWGPGCKAPTSPDTNHLCQLARGHVQRECQCHYCQLKQIHPSRPRV